MPELTKPFRGVPNGQIYPVQFKAGDVCPPELEAGARALGALNSVARAPLSVLVGSDTLPAEILVAEGKAIPLGDIVARAHLASGLSADAWNGLSPAERDSLLNDEIEKARADVANGDADADAEKKLGLHAQLTEAGIKFDKRWGLDKLHAALDAAGKA